MMEDLNFITQLEGTLKAAIHLIPCNDDRTDWQMDIKLFYDGGPAGETSFNLQGYSEEEACDLVKNLSKNEYLMKEIDEYLWGESG